MFQPTGKTLELMNCQSADVEMKKSAWTDLDQRLFRKIVQVLTSKEKLAWSDLDQRLFRKIVQVSTSKEKSVWSDLDQRHFRKISSMFRKPAKFDQDSPRQSKLGC
jgi:hypothetical protein